MSRRRYRIVALACTLCVLGGFSMLDGQVARRVASGPGYASGFGVVREWTGAKSGVTTRGAVVVTKEEEWATLWREHDGGSGTKSPAVDFDKEIVVAVFAGRTWNSRGYFVFETLRGPRSWVVRVDERTYQTRGPHGGGVKVTPFGLFVLPRVGGSVIVEENVQGLIASPPKWAVIAKQLVKVPGAAAPPEVAYKPRKTLHGKITHGKAGKGAEFSFFTSARNPAEWQSLCEMLEESALRKLSPDFDKELVIVAADMVPEGSGDYHLEFVGENASRTVLRLVKPNSRVEKTGEVDFIYGVWVLPKPTGELVIETPTRGKPGRPPRWVEEHVLMLGKKPS